MSHVSFGGPLKPSVFASGLFDGTTSLFVPLLLLLPAVSQYTLLVTQEESC